VFYADARKSSLLRDECTGTSVTLWTGHIRYKSLAVKGPRIEALFLFLALALKKTQPKRLWKWGNPVGISKECGKGGKPALRLSMLSILCHFHGLFRTGFEF
jgi:hypothetical protein